MSFIIYLSIIAFLYGIVLSKKFRCFVAAVILFALLVFGACALQNAARAECEVTKEFKVGGFITKVAPEYFNGYPVLIVTVECFDGNIYTYYSEDKIDTEGIVILTLFEDEVLNVE